MVVQGPLRLSDDLVERRIEIYTDPHGEEFLECTIEPPTGRFAPQRFPSARQRWLPPALLDLLR